MGRITIEALYAHSFGSTSVQFKGEINGALPRKRIARIMREDNLLAVREEWFEPAEHSFRAACVHLTWPVE